MALSYNGLWKMLIDKGLKKGDLIKKLGLSSSTIAKLSKNEPVSLAVLEKICIMMKCDIGDILHISEEERKMGLNDIVIKEGRPLPVVLLVDNSGSMANEKINTVNVALREMISMFSDLKNTKGKINVSVITFGDKVELVQPMEKVENISIPCFEAKGKTWMGEAIEKAIDMLEDRGQVPERAYTPTIILLSDGLPSDCPGKTNPKNYDFTTWEPLKRLHESERLKNCPKLALGIGQGTNYRMLKGFINNENVPVIKATDLATITKFFKWVTYTVSKRSVSANPNVIEFEDFKNIFGEEEFVL